MAEIWYIKPGPLRLSPNRIEGADVFKLIAQMQDYGTDFDDMPPPRVVVAAQGDLVLYKGVTRATRAYLADPDMIIPVEVIDVMAEWDVSHLPTLAQMAEEG